MRQKVKNTENTCGICSNYVLLCTCQNCEGSGILPSTLKFACYYFMELAKDKVPGSETKDFIIYDTAT